MKSRAKQEGVAAPTLAGRATLPWWRTPRWFFLFSLCLLVACSSPPPLMRFFFDIPPSGKPDKILVVHQPRRKHFVATNPLTVTKEYQQILDEMAKAGSPIVWADVLKKLPKDDDENIDWMTALLDEQIKPSPGIDPATKEERVLDLDIMLSTSGKPERKVIFSHLAHTQWLSCANCHPAIFEEKTGSAKITMDALDDGRYCGVCHDKVAIAEPSGCKGCHRAKVKKES